MGEVGTRRWAARRGAGGSARSRLGAGVSRVRERERPRVGTAGRGVGFFYRRGEAVRAAEKKISSGTVRDDPDLWRGGCRHICMTGYLIL